MGNHLPIEKQGGNETTTIYEASTNTYHKSNITPEIVTSGLKHTKHKANTNNGDCDISVSSFVQYKEQQHPPTHIYSLRPPYNQPHIAPTIALSLICYCNSKKITKSIDVRTDLKISELKELTAKLFCVALGAFRLSLFYFKPLLHDHLSLIDYGINNGSTIMVSHIIKNKLSIEDKQKQKEISKRANERLERLRKQKEISKRANERLERLRKTNDRLRQKLQNSHKWKGKRTDVFNLTTNKWWPSTVIGSNHDSIKVKYDGYSSKWDEWIKLGSARIAEIHKYTKNHEIHKILSTEAEKRKKEWRQSSFRLTPDVFRDVLNTECAYYDSCTDLMKRFVNITKINVEMFEPKGNRCFCPNCHYERGDYEVYTRGNPSQSYVLPIGYARFGIKLTSQQQNILKEWHVVYHGTKVSHLKEISECGLILLKPNDFKLSENATQYKVNKIRAGHIPQKFKRINKYTKAFEIFDTEQIFTSPSPNYSSKYCDIVDIDGESVSFMFQCRQEPGSYSRGQETMGYGDVEIDQWINNDSIEFYTKHNLNIIITGILIKVHNFTGDNDSGEIEIEEIECDQCEGYGEYEIGECFKCNGKGECSACNGSGIIRNRVHCHQCNGTISVLQIQYPRNKWEGDGLYETQYECKQCSGSGIFKPENRCRICEGSGWCKECDSTGKVKVKCKTCDGRGSYDMSF